MIPFSRSFCFLPVQLVPACKLLKELVAGTCLEDLSSCVPTFSHKNNFGSLEKRKMRPSKKELTSKQQKFIIPHLSH